MPTKPRTGYGCALGWVPRFAINRIAIERSIQSLPIPRRLARIAIYATLDLLLFCPGLNAQEDPARFLFVKEWVGTFTRSFTHSGSLVEPCKEQWDFSHSSQVTLPLLLDPGSGIWSGPTNDSRRVQVSGSWDEKCHEGTEAEQSRKVIFTGGTVRAEDFDLSIDPDNKTYTLRCGTIEADYTLTAVSKIGSDTVTGSLFMCWQGVADYPLPATGMAITGSKVIRAEDLVDVDDFCPLIDGFDIEGMQWVVTWNLVPIFEELEVVVEPSGYPNDTPFELWAPQGNLKDWNQFGNTLRVRAWLQTKEGQAPTNNSATFIFQLLDVSREPGVCMNWPIKALADTKADLRFDEERNDRPFVTVGFPAWLDEFTVASLPDLNAKGMPEAEALISSYDFGGYGKLKVTAQVAGIQIVGYLKSDPSKTPGEILLPKRTASSRIADLWKEALDVSNRPDDDDSENDPVGDGHKGDGLTLYEEYRGFSANRRPMSPDPTKKDLFIADTIGNWRSKSGIKLFESQSGLKVHHKFKPDELSSRADVIDRWINFNTSSQTPHVVDQHGLLLWKGSSPDEGEVVSPHFDFITTPASVEVVSISPFVTAPRQKAANISGINSIERAGWLILTDQVQAMIAHELAHGCSVWHHGECDQEEVPWTVKLTTNGFSIFERGLEIVLKEEPDSLFLVSPCLIPIATGTCHLDVWVGMPQGQHSGDEYCFMRYALAGAYPQRNSLNTRFLVAGDEFQGTSLCNSSTGTGINGDRVPQPRYGDAAPGRGNCKAQICVNDLYLRDPLHSGRDLTCP